MTRVPASPCSPRPPPRTREGRGFRGVSTQDKTQERIAKLLRLADNNPNPNEAAVAYARAQELATLAGLDLDDVSLAADEPEPVREVEAAGNFEIDVVGKRVAWRESLLRGYCNAYGCRWYIARCGRSTAYRVVGQPSDVYEMRKAYTRLVGVVDYHAREAVKAYKDDPDLDPRFDESPRSYGRAFRLGFAATVANELPTREATVEDRRKELEAAGESTALVRVDNALAHLKAVAAEVDRAYDALKLRSGRGLSGGRSSRGYADGRRAGRGASKAPKGAIG